MAKKFSALRAKMKPATLEKSTTLSQAMLDEMPLQELRQALALSQEQMARTLGIKQASVSKLERRTGVNYNSSMGLR